MSDNLDFTPPPAAKNLNYSVEIALDTATASMSNGEYIVAEVWLKLALKQADMTYGRNSGAVRHVLSALCDFYRNLDRQTELAALEKRLRMMPSAASQEPASDHQNAITGDDAGETDGSPLQQRLLGRMRQERSFEQSQCKIRRIPPEIRRSCQILGVPVEGLSHNAVHQFWKKAMSTTAHPDLGGDGEIAIMLNTARDTLVKWLDERESKLARKFEHILNPRSG